MKKGVLAPVLVNCDYADIHYRRVVVSRRNHRKMYHRLRKQAYRLNSGTRLPGYGRYLEITAYRRKVAAYAESLRAASR